MFLYYSIDEIYTPWIQVTFGLVNAYKTLRSARDQDPVQPQKLFIISASSWTTFFPSPLIEAEEVGAVARRQRIRKLTPHTTQSLPLPLVQYFSPTNQIPTTPQVIN